MFEVRITLEALKPTEQDALDFATSITSALQQAQVRGKVEVYDVQTGQSIWQTQLRRDS